MWDTAKSLWDAMTPEMHAAIVGGVTTVIAAILGVIAVVWQIGRQARHAIEQNRRNETLRLKLQVYEEFVPISRDASCAILDVSSVIQKFATDLVLIQTFRNSGVPWQVPEARSAAFLARQNDMNSKIVELISLTERWQIIEPRIEIFRKAISSARYNIAKAWQEYFVVALPVMPHEVAGHIQQGSLLPWQPPSQQKTLQLEQLSQHVQDALLELSSYIYDAQIEMQNLLLGELFRRRIPPREPVDPNAIVVRLDKFTELEAYFENETASGRDKNRNEGEVPE